MAANRLVIARTTALEGELLERLRRLCEDAFGHPFDEDWQHALGGTHFVVERRGDPLAHAAVVERALETRGVTLRTGYVEAVATRPDAQGRGLGARVLRAATEHIREHYELGALSTGEHAFYEQLGWERWRGPTFVRTDDGRTRTEDEDGGVVILRTPSSPPLDLDAAISCDWRPGDVW